MTAPVARVELLGGFDVSIGRQHPSWGLSTRRVLALLALRRRPMGRDRVAGSLWPDISEERAQGRLRTALWRLGSDRHRFVMSIGDRLSLEEGCGVDLEEAEDIGQELAWGGLPLGEERSVLVEFFSRDLLPGWDEPWLVPHREGYRDI